MDMLRRELAPISSEAWREIRSQAVRLLEATLTVRRVADVVGPLGIDFGAVSTGRISLPPKQADRGARYGVNRVTPLVEARSPFELDVWELDNAARGARDIELKPLEDAAREIARFEEEAVYVGLPQAGLEPLRNQSAHHPIEYGAECERLYPSLVAGMTTLRKAMVEGPYALVVPETEWNYLVGTLLGRPLVNHVQAVTGGPVLFSPYVPSPLLVSLRGGDLELILGRDIDIGYESYDARTVRLYFTESFTFRVLDASAFIFLV